ncbi:MAG TPA: hypothetical protein VM658_21850 [bacterium]|nr:hypothetical protein [bacterium]
MNETKDRPEAEEAEADPRAAEREAWIERLRLDGKYRMLFELEILLKGLDRFFNVENLPLANMQQVIALNFVDELEIILQFVDRVVELSGVLLDASRQEDYQFKYYIETKLLGDYERSRWREAVLEQENPEASLFVLYGTFLNLREILRGLTQLKVVPYTIFFNTGNLISREMLGNRYFNPSRPVEFRPEFDKVNNKRIGMIVRAVKDAQLQRNASIVVLAFNRLLQYLRFIDPRSESIEHLKSSLLFFALIHSESKYLMEFMETNLPDRLAGNPDKMRGPFTEACDSLSFQLQMELKKIHAGELLNLAKQKKLESVKTAVENSHGILMNFFQQSVIQILKVFESGLAGEEIFPVFISRRKQSLKLREDLAVFRSMMEKFEEITETTEAGMHLDTYLKYLVLQKGFVARMRRGTMPLMRYHDLVEFEKYLKFVEGLGLDDLHIMDKLDKFKMESKFFKILVETTLGHIDNRSELQGEPLDKARVERRLKRFVVEYLK